MYHIFTMTILLSLPIRTLSKKTCVPLILFQVCVKQSKKQSKEIKGGIVMEWKKI